MAIGQKFKGLLVKTDEKLGDAVHHYNEKRAANKRVQEAHKREDKAIYDAAYNKARHNAIRKKAKEDYKRGASGGGALSGALNVLVGDPDSFSLLGPSSTRKKKKSHSSYDDLFAF